MSDLRGRRPPERGEDYHIIWMKMYMTGSQLWRGRMEAAKCEMISFSTLSSVFMVLEM